MFTNLNSIAGVFRKFYFRKAAYNRILCVSSFYHPAAEERTYIFISEILLKEKRLHF